jgi:dethiobiotin synthetase
MTKTTATVSSGALVTRIVVLGTGTGVGKTWVTRTLTKALRRAGAWVVALKPVETGVDLAIESDAAKLASASTRSPLPPPFVFPDPISPHLAARRAGGSIALEPIVQYVVHHENELTSHVTSFCIIECAGGCFSPLAPGVTNEALARALEPAIWILVAPDALGVLHDVSATLGALGSRGRMPDYVVLSAAREPDASTGTNARELASLGIAAPVASVGHGDERALDELAGRLVLRATDAVKTG